MQWVTGVLALVLTVGLFAGWFIPAQQPIEIKGIPTAEENAAAIIALIPTAEDIAALIEDPYVTGPQVRDMKRDTAWDLSVAELETKDFLKEVRDVLVAGGENVDDYKDITKLSAKRGDDDSEIFLHWYGQNTAKVIVEFNAYYLIDGDEEECGKTIMRVSFRVDGLDRDKDYEDAEAAGWTGLHIEKIYNDHDYC